VDLDWDPSAGARTYNVKRSSKPGGPYTAITTGLTGFQYADKSVLTGFPYFYVLTGSGVNGESDNSPEFKVTP
jgi:hypothetical protein